MWFYRIYDGVANCLCTAIYRTRVEPLKFRIQARESAISRSSSTTSRFNLLVPLEVEPIYSAPANVQRAPTLELLRQTLHVLRPFDCFIRCCRKA
jgi:hypothetical protein